MVFKVVRVHGTNWIETQLRQSRQLRMHNMSIITFLFEYLCFPCNEFLPCPSKTVSIKSFQSQRTMISKWTNQLTQKCSKLLNYSNMFDLIDENKKQMDKMNRLQKISSRVSKMWLFGKIINFILYVSEGSEYMGMHVIVYCFFRKNLRWRCQCGINQS